MITIYPVYGREYLAQRGAALNLLLSIGKRQPADSNVCGTRRRRIFVDADDFEFTFLRAELKPAGRELLIRDEKTRSRKIVPTFSTNVRWIVFFSRLFPYHLLPPPSKQRRFYLLSYELVIFKSFVARGQRYDKSEPTRISKKRNHIGCARRSRESEIPPAYRPIRRRSTVNRPARSGLIEGAAIDRLRCALYISGARDRAAIRNRGKSFAVETSRRVEPMCRFYVR